MADCGSYFCNYLQKKQMYMRSREREREGEKEKKRKKRKVELIKTEKRKEED